MAYKTLIGGTHYSNVGGTFSANNGSHNHVIGNVDGLLGTA